MAEAAVEQIECGFCLMKEGTMESPKTLPCTHIHCLECLTDSYYVNGIVQCPFCRQVFDVVVESLPSANVRRDKSVCCDVCSKKGVNNQPAVTYCTACTAKYCTKHEESHDDLHMDHVKLTIDKYRIQARKLQPRICTVHRELQYSMGCRSCLTVFCKSCVELLGSCEDGGAHKLMSMDQLVAVLTTEIDMMRAKVIDKEEKLSALFKLTSRIISEFDTETETMIQTLHRTRDEQVEAIQLKYNTLEADFLKLRKSAKSCMTTSMEVDIGVTWSELSRHRLRIDAGLKLNHQVDFVNRYEDTTKKIQKLISNTIPTLEFQNMVILEVKGQERELEVEVVAGIYAFISLETGLTTPAPLPASMTLLQTVRVSGQCLSVYHYQGNTYVGLDNRAVDKIDGSYQLNRSFLTLSGLVVGITVYKDRVYTLVYGSSNHAINVHDLTGRLITNWVHTASTVDHQMVMDRRIPTYSDTDYSTDSYTNKLAIVDNLIIILDRLNELLSVYSLTGEVIKHLPCPLLSEYRVAMCAADNHSVVISDFGFSQVLKVNISTGDISWAVNHINRPEGVTCCKRRVFVANHSTTTGVWILDENTGELLTEISDPASHAFGRRPLSPPASYGRPLSPVYGVIDLHISGNTLIVSKSNEQKVLFYELN